MSTAQTQAQTRRVNMIAHTSTSHNNKPSISRHKLRTSVSKQAISQIKQLTPRDRPDWKVPLMHIILAECVVCSKGWCQLRPDRQRNKVRRQRRHDDHVTRCNGEAQVIRRSGRDTSLRTWGTNAIWWGFR